MPSDAKIGLLGALAGLGSGQGLVGGAAEALLAKKLLGKPRSMKKGGEVKKTGYVKLHRGEQVVPARAARALGKGKKADKKKKVVFDEFKTGKLHSGKGKTGKKGPVVTNRKQAIAIALSEARKAGK